jgi:hypothetical protein
MAMPSPVASQRQPSWADVKTKLDAFDRKSLIGLIHDLYEASTANRRFLHARLLPSPSAVEKYRRLVTQAVFPDPFSRRRVSLRDATAAITEYRRSTGDVTGTVDLMLTFIEVGTEQAADLGYGDEDYFSALENKINAVAKSWPTLPADARAKAATRLAWVQERATAIGWGYGDYVDDVVTRLKVPGAEKAGSKKPDTRSNKALELTAPLKSRAPRLSASRWADERRTE